MNAYLPFAEKHSVQEVQIALHFQGAFDQPDIERSRDAAESDLREDLPRVVEIQGGTFTLDAANRDMPITSAAARLVGFERSRVGGDGKTARMLRLAEDVLLASIADYDGWELARVQSVDYMRAALSPLPLNVNPVMRIGLHFIDRYAFNGPIDDADARLLFRDDGEYIARRCFAAGALWHCHTGWFDGDVHGHILNHLNIASAIVDGCPTVTIDHNAVLQLNRPRQSTDALREPPEQGAGIKPILNNLYDANRAILSSILTPEMHSKTGRLPQ